MNNGLSDKNFGNLSAEVSFPVFSNVEDTYSSMGVSAQDYVSDLTIQPSIYGNTDTSLVTVQHYASVTVKYFEVASIQNSTATNNSKYHDVNESNDDPKTGTSAKTMYLLIIVFALGLIGLVIAGMVHHNQVKIYNINPECISNCEAKIEVQEDNSQSMPIYLYKSK